MSDQVDRLSVGMCPGLTCDIILSLQLNGIYTVSDLIDQDLEQLALKSRVSCKELVVIRHVLSAQFAALPVPASVQFEEILNSGNILSTGYNELNDYLDGGVYTQEILEIVGEVASGKTQLCLSVAISLAVCMKMSTVWIDTCGSFDLRRIEQMLKERTLDMEDLNNASSHLYSMTAFTPLDLLATLEKTKRLLSDLKGTFSSVRLIVIDTVSVLLSSLLSGTSSEGHSVLVQISRSIKEIISDYPVAVLVTNSLTSSSTLSSKVPALGRVWASVPNVRLLLHRESSHRIHPSGSESLCDDNQDIRRWATLIKSCRQACRGHIPFAISEYGFVSP